MTPSPTETVLAFVRAINRHEIATITNLMSDDHVFVDSLGVTVAGKDQMRQAWIAYLYMIPDYTIVVADVCATGTSIMLTGTARGTVAVEKTLPPENRWEIPLAVRAEVHDGRIARWQVFADHEPIRAILSARPS